MQDVRPSTETDRRRLLANSTTTSRAPSVLTDGDRTPRARSPAPSYATTTRHGSLAPTEHTTAPQSYRGFPSEEHYLAALREFIEEKKYLQPTENPSALTGWYGTKTMEDYKKETGPPLPELGWRRKWKERKENKRRASAAV